MEANCGHGNAVTGEPFKATAPAERSEPAGEDAEDAFWTSHIATGAERRRGNKGQLEATARFRVRLVLLRV